MARKPQGAPQGVPVPDAQATLAQAPEGPAAGVALVRMHRTPGDAGSGALAADVHPAEVVNYAATGWRLTQG